ncbi:tripartite tricarboxylate transporter TctB family protein [Thalassospira xiamenensis]|uniref:tripartite tricarboxylate transporter TctB family protein n=1 Tax=Thalassospira xiamenensis TaxID=220697 RepID=UPI000BE31D83|nr:tripartite tricarboxylate transporter TctB family protein [Thalassospira xiamenensis]
MPRQFITPAREESVSTVSESRSSLYIGGGLLLFCGFAAWRTALVKAQSANTVAGPSFLPWIMIGLISALSVALIVRSLKHRNDKAGVSMPDRKLLLRMGMFTILLVAYAAAFMPLGYLPSTLITFCIGLYLVGERRPVALIAFPVLTTGIIYLGFTNFLKVWLP